MLPDAADVDAPVESLDPVMREYIFFQGVEEKKGRIAIEFTITTAVNYIPKKIISY